MAKYTQGDAPQTIREPNSPNVVATFSSEGLLEVHDGLAFHMNNGALHRKIIEAGATLVEGNPPA